MMALVVPLLLFPTATAGEIQQTVACPAAAVELAWAAKRSEVADRFNELGAEFTVLHDVVVDVGPCDSRLVISYSSVNDELIQGQLSRQLPELFAGVEECGPCNDSSRVAQSSAPSGSKASADGTGAFGELLGMKVVLEQDVNASDKLAEEIGKAGWSGIIDSGLIKYPLNARRLNAAIPATFTGVWTSGERTGHTWIQVAIDVEIAAPNAFGVEQRVFLGNCVLADVTKGEIVVVTQPETLSRVRDTNAYAVSLRGTRVGAYASSSDSWRLRQAAGSRSRTRLAG